MGNSCFSNPTDLCSLGVLVYNNISLQYNHPQMKFCEDQHIYLTVGKGDLELYPEGLRA